jgi:hypothetical protein
MPSVSMESFTTKAKAEKRAREIKRLGSYATRVRPDGAAWVVEYWQEG